jgi:hypothetical protein
MDKTTVYVLIIAEESLKATSSAFKYYDPTDSARKLTKLNPTAIHPPKEAFDCIGRTRILNIQMPRKLDQCFTPSPFSNR